MNRKLLDKSTGLLTGSDFYDRKNCVFYWLMFAVLLVIVAVCILPVLWVIVSAFKNTEEFYSIPITIIPRSFNPGKIAEVFKTLNFGRYYLNTLIYAIGYLAFTLVFNGLGGYVLSRVKPKGYNFVFLLIFWTMMMPTAVNLIPLYMSFVDLPILHINLMNTYWPMWIMAGANCFDILLFRSFFNTLPKEYDEAAAIDGCTKLQTLFKVILPLCTPIVITVSIFSINGAIGDFFWPYLIIKKSELMPFAVQLYQMGQAGVAEDVYMVALLLAMIPSIVIFALFSRKIMGGINVGGIKG